MTEMIIEKGIVIDDVESVLCGIRELSARKIENFETIKKFILSEKNTKFYLDNKLNSYMQPDQGCIYIWLDTGYTDFKGNPILISLLRGWEGFVGHVVGTIHTLAESVRSFFRLNRNMVSSKVVAFRNKYESKADTRDIKHIEDEQEYLMKACCSSASESVFAQKFEEIGIDMSVLASDLEPEMTEVEEVQEEALSAVEEEITIGLLLEKMEGMQAYMDELLQLVENVSNESSAQIAELQKKNKEYKRVIVQMRTFSQQEAEEEKSPEEMTGHDLLGDHSKILVIGGQELGVNIMQGIAKMYGFDKKDFEFVDYDKAKDFTDRIRKDGKYRAVIFGACPHKTTGLAGYSSTFEKMKNESGMPYAADARSKSGKLKVTKESFRSALELICQDMRLAYAC